MGFKWKCACGHENNYKGKKTTTANSDCSKCKKNQKIWSKRIIDQIKKYDDNFWNILLLLDRVAADMVFRDKNHWENYKVLWNTPLWYAGVNLRRILDGNPKGSFHHKGKYMTNYTRIFTNGQFVENHKKGVNK